MNSFMRRMSVLLMAALVITAGNFSFAKGSSSFGGGSRSSGGMSRSSIGGSSRSSAPSASPSKSAPAAPASKPASSATRNDTPSKSAIGGSNSSASSPASRPAAPKLSPADMAQAKSVKQQGPVAATREQGVNNYLKSNPKLSTVEGKTSQYNHFTSEPSSRPVYIPQTTYVGGRSVNISFNSGYGGYGYMDPLTNMWVNAMIIDSIANSAIDRDMAMNGYRYQGDGFAPVVVHRSMSVWSFLFGIIVLLFVVGIFWIVLISLAESER